MNRQQQVAPGCLLAKTTDAVEQPHGGNDLDDQQTSQLLAS